MQDHFHDKAADWDSRPVPQQISEGVSAAIAAEVNLQPTMTVMDFGAGTGLVSNRIAPRVKSILAVDLSAAMLAQLAKKPELRDKVEIFCQDIIDAPLGRTVDLVVSAMAMHHVEDTRALFRALYQHLVPGGRIALADLDTEKGDFHPPETVGVYHSGFDRDGLAGLLTEVGFAEPRFVTACEVTKEDRRYSIFLVTASKPA